MIEALRNIFSLPDLRRRIFYTLGILILYRLLANIPVPGANLQIFSSLGDTFNQSGNALIDTLDLLSGGAVSNFSILAMGVYPYITASIIIQLLTPIIPYLEELQQEGESGRNRINKITYYLTVPLALVQAVGQVQLIGFSYGGVANVLPGWGFGNPQNILITLMVLACMIAGTMFAIWLGERITEDGIGQGISLIIFSGIVAGIPTGLFNLISGRTNFGATITPNVRIIALVTFIILLLVTTYVVIMIQEGNRRIPVQYGRRMRGRKVYQGQSSYVPMKVNTAGMIPIIFASSLLAFPSLIAQIFRGDDLTGDLTWYNNVARGIENVFNSQTQWNGWNNWAIFWIFYFLLVFAFTFFYTDVMVGQQRLHENLQRQGGFIPGIRPGKRTEQYIRSVVRRITLLGAFFLAAVSVVPGIMLAVAQITGMQGLEQSALIVDGAGLIIVVGVVIDTMRQLESQLLMRNYEGFTN